MEYAILDEIQEKSEENREIYQQKNNVFVKSGLEELNEAWTGSDNKIKAYIYHNYCRLTGPIDIIIIIREYDTGEQIGDFALKQVESAIYPLYSTRAEDSIDIPAETPAPNLHPDVVKFILEKRSLPKKKYNDGEFDPTRNKWDINRLATTLNMSNRVIARFCRAKNI